MTAEWNTTRVAWTGACATRARQLVEQVAPHEVRRVLAGDPHGCPQPLAALLLLGPDHRLQPPHGVVVGDVDR